MQTKALLFAILLSGLGTMLYGRPPVKLDFSPSKLPNGQYGSTYNQVIKVTGGTAPYTFSVSLGILPPGLSLSSGGTLSGKPTAAGTYAFTVTATDHAANPNSGTQLYTLVIDQAALTIKANDATMTYGGAVPALSATYNGFVNGDNAANLTLQPILSTTASSFSPPGTYSISALGALDPNYTITYQSGKMTVGKAVLTVTADDKSMPLGGPLPALTVSYSGFVNLDNASSLTTKPTATTNAKANSPAGSYPITPGGGASPNYTFSYVNGTLTVAAAAPVLTITANPASSVYGAALVPNGSLTVSYSGFINGDGPGNMTTLPTVTNSAVAGSPVGTYTLTPSGAVNPKYTIRYVTGNYTISPAPLTVTADNKSMPVGGPLPALTVSYSGFVNGDGASSLTTQATAATNAKANSPAGSYPITASGGSSPNYTFSYVNGTLTVAATAILTITANPAGSVYGSALVPSGSLTVTYSGFINGDGPGNMTTLPTVANTAVAGSPVGAYTLTPSGAVNPKYTIRYVTGTYTISRAPLTITADSKTMLQGGPLPTLTVSYSGFVNGDNASNLTTPPVITTTATANSPAGSYPINVSGAAANNYTISYVTGILAVGKSLLTITANPASSVYGAALVPNGSLTVSYSGFANGDGPSSLTTLPTVTNAAVAGSPVGTYALVPSGAQSSKYVITYINGAYTITPAALTITAANKTMTYGSAVPPLTATYSGFVNGDNASKLPTPPTISTAASSTSPVGTYPINISGAVDANYTITYVGATMSIGKATLSVTPDPATMPTGGPLPVFTATYSGFVAGDTVSDLTTAPTITTTATVSSPAGTYPTTAAGGVSPNYSFVYHPGTLTIDDKTQHITWNQSLVIGCVEQTQLTLTATVNTGLPITYTVADPTIATVAGNILTILKPGSTVITATQPGDAAHTAAPPVKDTLQYEPGSLIRQRWSDVIFFDNSAGYYESWQWYKNGSAVQGATDPYYSETPTLNGKYYVIATDKAGTKVQSCTLDIPPGAAIPGGIKVFPNPAAAGAKVTVTSNYSELALQGAVMTVVDLSGKVRQTLTNIQPSMQLTMPAESGTYIITLQLPSGPRATVNVLVVQ